MDVPRQGQAEKRRRRGLLYGVAALGLLAVVSLLVARLEPAARAVETETLRIDTVRRGEMLREVRGPGTLVPEETRWVAALTEGRVERVLAEPGDAVEPDTLVLELSNPVVERAALDAELRLAGARADYRNLQVRLESELLGQRADAAQVEAEYQEAVLELEANEELDKDGLVPAIELKRSLIRRQQLENRLAIEQQRLSKTEESVTAQLGSESARLREAEGLFELRRSERDSLAVRAGLGGVVQQVAVEEGQQVSPGAKLALIAEPQRLMAELRIAEVQAKDVRVGLIARVDTRNGVVDGRVSRIDPAARQGTVLVDVELVGELPAGARPQLSVDGTIELERLADVLHVGRPAFAQPASTAGIFKLSADGKEAARVPVRFGRSSVSAIEIVEGLSEGDRVILSDSSQYAREERLRLR